MGARGSELARHWTLDGDVDFLNHGSFGACPRVVLEAQSELRARLERQPVRFFLREAEALFDAARERLAAFVGADPEGLVAVTNATSGVNAVLSSLRLSPGDELLVTDHAYGSCRYALEHVAARAGARSVVARIPFPLACEDEAFEAVLAAATPRTRIALLDHVTSPTALVMPVARLVRALRERGIEALVDGAHGPGMLDLDLRALGAAYYTGNCHKWACAPKGAAFLWARADRREGLFPAVISHGWGTSRAGRPRLHDLFDWPGTADPTAFLCVPAALDALASLVPGGWPAIRRRNHALALEAQAILCEAQGVPRPCPETMIGSMAAVPLPDGGPLGPRWALATCALQDALLERHGIEVPIHPWPEPPKRLVRASAHLYNDRAQHERLARALQALLAEGL